MKKIIPGYLPLAGLLTIFGFAPVDAAVVGTSAEYYVNSVLVDSDSDSDSLSSSASASGGSGFASAYSDSTGILNVNASTGDGGIATAASPIAFPAPSGAETAIAAATWSDTITNGTGTPIDYRYVFHVSNPRVGISGNAGDFAALSLDITLDGTSIWSAFVALDDTSDLSYDSKIAAPTFFDDFSAYFASFDAAADLGTLAPGEDFTIAYELKAYANSGLSEGAVFAAVGDPAFPEGNPLEIIASPVGRVPDGGASAVLLGLAMSGIIALRRGLRARAA